MQALLINREYRDILSLTERIKYVPKEKNLVSIDSLHAGKFCMHFCHLTIYRDDFFKSVEIIPSECQFGSREGPTWVQGVCKF